MDYSILQNTFKGIVEEYADRNLKKAEGVNVHFEVYVVWFCKTLQHAKALLSTSLPDGMYYELTYNGDKDEIYLDAYNKVDNLKLTTKRSANYETTQADSN